MRESSLSGISDYSSHLGFHPELAQKPGISKRDSSYKYILCTRVVTKIKHVKRTVNNTLVLFQIGYNETLLNTWHYQLQLTGDAVNIAWMAFATVLVFLMQVYDFHFDYCWVLCSCHNENFDIFILIILMSLEKFHFRCNKNIQVLSNFAVIIYVIFFSVESYIMMYIY